MKRILLIGIILSFTASAIYGQGWNRKKKKKDQKIYISTFLNADLNPILYYSEEPLINDEFNNIEVDQFGTVVPGLKRNIQSNSETVGLGFSIQKLNGNNKYTEFSITKFKLQQYKYVNFRFLETGSPLEPISGDRKVNFETAFRYEYGTYFNLQQEGKLRIGMAGGLAPYFSRYQTLPKTSASFPQVFIRYGVKLEFIPSISFQCAKNGFIDFKWSPSIFDFNRNRIHIANPILTENQRTQSYSIPSFFQTPLSFQLHYRHRILSKKEAKRAFRKKRKKKADVEETKKKSAIYVNPIINIYRGKEDHSHEFTYSRGQVDTFSNFIETKPLINVGIGFQFVKENGLYSEISLTRFSRKQAFTKIVDRYATVPNLTPPPTIDETESKEFSLAMRFAMGKVFNSSSKSKMLFSLGLGIEPFYASYELAEGTTVANIGAALKFIPSLSFKLSNRTNLQFRWTPSVYSGYKQTFNFDEGPDLNPIETDPWNFQSLPNLGNCSVGIRVRVF